MPITAVIAISNDDNLIPAAEAHRRSCMVQFKNSEHFRTTNGVIEAAIAEGKTKAGVRFLPTVSEQIVRGCVFALQESGYNVEIIAVPGVATQVNACW